MRALAESEVDLTDADGAHLDLSDLEAGEFVDLANSPAAADPFADIGDLMAEYEHDAYSQLREIADDAEAFRDTLDAWAAEHDPENAEAFANFALTELAAAGYSTDRVATPAQLHEAFLLERSRARAISLLGDDLDEDLAQALLSGLDRSMFGTGPDGAARRSSAMTAIKALRADGITVAEAIEPGRGTVWRVAAQ
ncbi:hypothetical protein [Cellulosimicrobium sp. Marseille-Q4280]|uniref:hypothetical protein n=1 Tax=Cellulosimicrobium sp. Marseille-Q4280 TaxID=2937992 RepID=UPI00203B070D|nr:hypothetical protein [Cellulosimicrobium sp. Marseille-Q4280]